MRCRKLRSHLLHCMIAVHHGGVLHLRASWLPFVHNITTNRVHSFIKMAVQKKSQPCSNCKIIFRNKIFRDSEIMNEKQVRDNMDWMAQRSGQKYPFYGGTIISLLLDVALSPKMHQIWSWKRCGKQWEEDRYYSFLPGQTPSSPKHTVSGLNQKNLPSFWYSQIFVNTIFLWRFWRFSTIRSVCLLDSHILHDSFSSQRICGRVQSFSHLPSLLWFALSISTRFSVISAYLDIKLQPRTNRLFI